LRKTASLPYFSRNSTLALTRIILRLLWWRTMAYSWYYSSTSVSVDIEDKDERKSLSLPEKEILE
jgi:hypothetical protein